MASAPIDIQIRIPGLAQVKRLEQSMKGLDAQVNKISKSAPRAANNIRRIGQASKQASVGANKLTKALGGLIKVYAGFQAAKFVILKTAELETQTRSLKVLTGDLEIAKNIVKELQSFGAVTPFTSTELIDTARRLAAFGVETENLIDLTKRLGDVAGATGADLGGIATAFGQIVAKGRLQGEELLQLQERGVGLQEELQRMYGLTGDEFRKALEKGRISAEAVTLALKNLTSVGGKYADGAIAQSDTLAGKFSTLVDGITRIAQAIGEVLTPVLKSTLDLAINTVNAINQALAARSMTDQQKQGFQRQAEAAVQNSAGVMPGGPFGLGQVSVRFNGKTYEGQPASVVSQITNDLINNAIQEQVDANAPKVTESNLTITVPPLLGQPSNSSSGGSSSSSSSSGLSAVNQEAEEAERLLKQQLEAGEDLSREFSRQIELKQTQNEYDRQLLENAYKFEDAVRRIVETAAPLQQEGLISQAATLKDLEELDTLKQAAENFGFSFGQEVAEKLPEVNAGLTETEQLLSDAYGIVANGLSGSIQGLIDGTKDWNDVLSDVLGNLGNMLLQFGFNSLGAGLGIPGFAEGGDLPTNGPAIVGENGPELVMNRGGRSTVYSNSDTKAAMSRYTGNDAQSISDFVVGAGGYGGIFGRGADAVQTTFQLETTVINGVEYATVDQVRAMGAEATKNGAKMGEARTLRKLQMSPGSRRKVGM